MLSQKVHCILLFCLLIQSSRCGSRTPFLWKPPKWPSGQTNRENLEMRSHLMKSVVSSWNVCTEKELDTPKFVKGTNMASYGTVIDVYLLCIVIFTGLTCQHVSKAVDLNSVKKTVLSSVWFVCSDCLKERTMIDSEPGASNDIVVCLKCGFQVIDTALLKISDLFI